MPVFRPREYRSQRPRHTCPQLRAAEQWARTQSNLGNALQEQGRRTGGAEGARLLGEAVAAYRAALEVLTAEHFPAYHEVVQANLAGALQDLEQTS